MKPNSATPVGVAFSMHEGMGGPHTFVIDLRTNDPVEPVKKLTVKADYVPPR